MADFLSAMALASERRAKHARRQRPLDELRVQVREAGPPLPLRMSLHGFDIIAEVKRRTPGSGCALLKDPDPAAAARRALGYSEAVAAAVSVLTEPLAFGGDLADLAASVEALESAGVMIPVMRKDFVVDAYSLFEARAAGASGVLLISELLTPDRLEPILDAAEETGLWLLVESFGRVSLRRAIEIAAAARHRGTDALLGINSRDLRTLAVDEGRLAAMAPHLPAHPTCVAESGLVEASDASRVVRLGYRIALVGSSLMEATDPAAHLRSLLEAGRSTLEVA